MFSFTNGILQHQIFGSDNPNKTKWTLGGAEVSASGFYKGTFRNRHAASGQWTTECATTRLASTFRAEVEALGEIMGALGVVNVE